MMLDHLGEHDAAAGVMVAIEDMVADARAPLTADLGARARTEELTREIVSRI
jgi:tartrate dehydrogenase/decarboxylase/D-malate dehydrogenase